MFLIPSFGLVSHPCRDSVSVGDVIQSLMTTSPPCAASPAQQRALRKRQKLANVPVLQFSGNESEKGLLGRGGQCRRVLRACLGQWSPHIRPRMPLEPDCRTGSAG